ncbi:hypothetical protein [Sphingobacterium sp. SYP-B4668]|uniref:hypothetical protein n=1 Tax=Sphingobacterium sp. SYP-B4668 TaxID=2996035 RepID=UPI0022DD02B2|nr:hypothetical protein [Sphingobacterium sp. SYP-B4668]
MYGSKTLVKKQKHGKYKNDLTSLIYGNRHGASANSKFMQVAITEGKRGTAVCLADVTDEEYHSGDR